MNKQRRKDIGRAVALLEEANAIIQQAGEEEREYYDNMPESIQGGEKGDKADGDAQILEDAQNEIESQVEYLQHLIGE